MNKQMKVNPSISISSSTSVFPSHENTSRQLHSGELLTFLLDDKHSESRISERVMKIELDEEVDTIQEYSNIDEEAPTIRSESSVLCMNCFESVELEKIDAHSLKCVKPVKNLLKIQQKIQDFLSWLREFKTESRELYLYPSIVLEDIVKNVLNNKIVKNTQNFRESFKKIAQTAQNFHHLPVILLATHRLALLVEALANESDSLRDSHQDEFGFNEDELSSVLSFSKSQNSTLTDFNEEIQNSRLCNSETIEKFFYSQFIKSKIQLKSNSSLSMFELYERCQKERIPIEHWRSFIESSIINN